MGTEADSTPGRGLREQRAGRGAGRSLSCEAVSTRPPCREGPRAWGAAPALEPKAWDAVARTLGAQRLHWAPCFLNEHAGDQQGLLGQVPL